MANHGQRAWRDRIKTNRQRHKPTSKGEHKLISVCWNITIVLDNTNSGGHSERHSALTAHELSQVNIDIAALSEVPFYEDSTQ
uniref:Endo/exonuclease/phosphatase domain-containing protein n=1 Tax=Loa loa TaxID=7209 RepID=A0A1I7VDU7_LOALO